MTCKHEFSLSSKELTFTGETVPNENSEPLATYRAMQTNQAGITDNGTLVTGIALVADTPGFEWIHEEIENLGADAVFVLPEEGLKLGRQYSARAGGLHKDWETGNDEYDHVIIEEIKELN